MAELSPWQKDLKNLVIPRACERSQLPTCDCLSFLKQGAFSALAEAMAREDPIGILRVNDLLEVVSLMEKEGKCR